VCSKSFPTREVSIPSVTIKIEGEIEGEGEGKGKEGGADTSVEGEEIQPKTQTVTDCPFSQTCLLEILCIAQFEDMPDGTSMFRAVAISLYCCCDVPYLVVH
tara:strand:+ start:1327 stop:1632 length:306 start_codon:yes stop_codon:yes gene_type:complete